MNASIQSAFNNLIVAIREDIRQDFLSALAGSLPIGKASTTPKPTANGHSWQTKTERAKGEKRRPDDLAALVVQLNSYITKHPGERIEQVSTGMSVPTKDLALPVKKLLAAKKIRTTGEKRATRYYPKGN